MELYYHSSVTPSWRGAQLNKTLVQLCLYIYLYLYFPRYLDVEKIFSVCNSDTSEIRARFGVVAVSPVSNPGGFGFESRLGDLRSAVVFPVAIETDRFRHKSPCSYSVVTLSFEVYEISSYLN
jgi:hypothetical protein